MECPVCRLLNPPASLRCDCGYDFVHQSGGRRQSLIRPRAILHSLWLVWLVITICDFATIYLGRGPRWNNFPYVLFNLFTPVLFGNFTAVPLLLVGLLVGDLVGTRIPWKSVRLLYNLVVLFGLRSPSMRLFGGRQNRSSFSWRHSRACPPERAAKPRPVEIKRGANPADIIHQMRTLVWFLICAIACRAQPPEDQVLAVYRQMEKAEQTGDANAWVGLWSRESASKAEKMRPYLRPRPDARYTSSKVFVQGDDAVLLGQTAPNQFLSMRLVKEDGRWKIKDLAFGDKAYPAESVYAMLPPAAGAFERAGAPWQNVASAFDNAGAARHGWQVRATYDESFLYIRIESSTPIPAPGASAEKPPMGWPVLKVETTKAGVSGVGEFVLHANANIGDQATFDESGRANTHRHYVAYWLMLERAGQMIFQAWADLNPSPLVQAGDHFLDLRVPLRTLSVADATQTKIIIGDAQSPKSAIFNVQVQKYQ
jgi:hypothetical protein